MFDIAGNIILFVVGLLLLRWVTKTYGSVVFEERDGNWLAIISRRLLNIVRWPYLRHINPLVALSICLLLGFWLYSIYTAFSRIIVQATVNEARICASYAENHVGTTILVLGVDNDDIGIYRSDTIKVVYFAPPNGNMRILSIPRDTRVVIDEIGSTKINAAYAYGMNQATQRFGAMTSPDEGGMALAAATVEQFLDIPIHGVIRFDFHALVSLVDALGGVVVNVPERIIDERYPNDDGSTRRVVFEPGLNTMDGATALIYARTRYGDSDFARSARQSQIIDAVLTKFMSMGVIGIPALIRAAESIAGGAFLMNIPFNTLPAQIAMVERMIDTLSSERDYIVIAPPIVPIDQLDGSDIVWNTEALDKLITTFVAPGEQALSRIQVLNGTTQPGLATRYTKVLARGGCAVHEPADAPRDDLATSVIYSRDTQHDAIAARIAQHLGIAFEREAAPEGYGDDASIIVVLGSDSARQTTVELSAP